MLHGQLVKDNHDINKETKMLASETCPCQTSSIRIQRTQLLVDLLELWTFLWIAGRLSLIGLFLDCFRAGAVGRDNDGCQLSSHGGSAFWRGNFGGTLRSFQRGVDADNENDGAAGEFAGGVARAKGGADQRCAFGPCTQWELFAADGRDDSQGRAGCNFYHWRSV